VDEKNTLRQIVIEEAIRLMALEVVIGLPPIGIAETMGASQQLVNVIAVISLLVPLAIAIVLIVLRTRSRQEQTKAARQLLMNKKRWIVVGLGTLAGILLALLYMTSGLINRQQAIMSILVALLWIGLGTWFSIRRHLQ